MDEDFISELRDYTIRQMKDDRNPEVVQKLVAELMQHSN